MGVEYRADDERPKAVLAAIEDPNARRGADFERAFLVAIGGFCKTPLAAYAEVSIDGSVFLEGMRATLDGKTVLRERVTVSPTGDASDAWDE